MSNSFVATGNQLANPIRYTRTDDPEVWTDVDSNCRTLLVHLDLDVFANRHDSLPFGTRLTVPDLDSCVTEARRMAKALRLIDGISIRSFAIGLSPGFCPSSYWRHLLEAIYCELADTHVLPPCLYANVH